MTNESFGSHAVADAQLPLPVLEVFGRTHLQSTPGSAPDALLPVVVPSNVIQNFRPLSQSLEWALAQLYWKIEGVFPFVRSEVPFMICNDGLLAEAAAIVLFANCREATDSERFCILELGAGAGLFARFFLDSFQTLCRQENTDYYERLLYFVTDASTQTVTHWAERGLFTAHYGHAVLGICDAANPVRVEEPGGTRHELAKLRAVFGNYVLDVLPSTMFRSGSNGLEQLCVRTHLNSDASVLKEYTQLSLEEIRVLAASSQRSDLEQLIPLMTLFEYETAFLAVQDDLAQHAAEFQPDELTGERTLLNFGAIAAIRQCCSLLSDGGFLLINDYGVVGKEESRAQSACERFGSTVAHGINFPFLESHLSRCGLRVTKAEGDDGRPIHSRLISRGDLVGTLEAYANRFAANTWEYFESPVGEARAQVAAGQKEAALNSYKTALVRQPRNWRLIAEAGEFVGLQLRDFAAGVELLQRAIELNPCLSSWLWNILGDCLYCQGRFADAHEAYLQAARIDDRDPRTCLNLAYTRLHRGEHEAALEAIARGLAHDYQGVYVGRLLEKQQHVIATIAARAKAEQERLNARMNRFR